MALKGYHSYRGRQGVWRIVLAVMLVLILLGACAFLFLQRFITYSDDGTFRLELPEIAFLDKVFGEREDGSSPGQNVDLVIESNGDTEEKQEDMEQNGESSAEQVEPTPPAAATRPSAPLRLLGIDELPQDGETLMELLSGVGADGFVFTAKVSGGEVRFASTSALPDAVAAGAVSGETLTRLCAREGTYTVAKINCFHDTAYAFANMETAGICQPTGYIWYDYGMGHWLDPEKEAARRYVIDLALECAQLGFDELMLEDVCYPATGKLYKIDYSGNRMTKTDALAQFLTQLREELEPYGVRLSLLLREEDVTGTAQDVGDTGFAADRILPLVDAVYVATEEPEAAESSMKALLGDTAAPMLIPVVEDDTAVGGWYLPQ